MITSIKFSSFVSGPKPVGPIGNPAGYRIPDTVMPVPVHIKRVNLNG